MSATRTSATRIDGHGRPPPPPPPGPSAPPPPPGPSSYSLQFALLPFQPWLVAAPRRMRPTSPTRLPTTPTSPLQSPTPTSTPSRRNNTWTIPPLHSNNALLPLVSSRRLLTMRLSCHRTRIAISEWAAKSSPHHPFHSLTPHRRDLLLSTLTHAQPRPPPSPSTMCPQSSQSCTSLVYGNIASPEQGDLRT